MSDLIKVKGTIQEIKDLQTISDKFSKRELWLELPADDPKYNQLIAIDFINKSIPALDDFNTGDEVEISLNLRGRESKGRVFNSLAAFSINLVGVKKANTAKKEVYVSSNPDFIADEVDSLPF
jgi:hypothetical protein